MKESLDIIAKTDGRYNLNAVKFVYESLSFIANNAVEEPYHVSGQDLCEGLKKLAIKKWGRLAMLVLNSWNIRSTRDFGEIVYLMIRHEWMNAQPADSIDDFNDVYDFKSAFKDRFEF